MGRTSTRLTGFCRSRVATRVRARSQRIDSKSRPAMVDTKSFSNVGKASSNATKQVAAVGRKIMIVAESRPEAKGALQWALSHAVQSNDTVVLLNVVKPAKHVVAVNPKGFECLYAMKSICESRRPEVKVELCLREGTERGPAIIDEARKQGVSLLVLGQKKQSVTWRLLMMWAGNRIRGGGVVEYCIQNASCMTLAVRRKSKRSGGYLITTKRHKDFWLLA
ncbi:uncharacterized protein [Typha latifolia]|uniref:uncharacterized protein n=1 Tax=Typha latifolia TaxID=4733 RepID=UPI003C30B81B